MGSRRKMCNHLLVQDVEYADDKALVTDSMDGLEGFLQTLDSSCTQLRLTIKTRKSKIKAITLSTEAFLTAVECCFEP